MSTLTTILDLLMSTLTLKLFLIRIAGSGRKVRFIQIVLCSRYLNFPEAVRRNKLLYKNRIINTSLERVYSTFETNSSLVDLQGVKKDMLV